MLPPVTGMLPSSAMEMCNDRACSACVMGTTTRRTLPIESGVEQGLHRRERVVRIDEADGHEAVGVQRDESAHAFVGVVEVVRGDRAVAEDPSLVDPRGIHRAQQRLRFRLLRILRVAVADARVGPVHP